ncbi:MAG: alanine:cation symporter family protein [Pseudomonadales bacterium]|nr:alanine:cation symporter family protein [Pseudomonadales bacterium]MCP5185701.1 alanine:cation symporter family protein [Pseudomonadales bacterium]
MTTHSTRTGGLDAAINDAVQPVTDAVSSVVFYAIPVAGTDMPLIVLWLIGGGLFFTLYLGFINLRGFRHACRVISGRYAKDGDPGEISQFSALTTAISGTVGIGNIAGVAVAISVGGPGATFWMIVAGLLGMSTKLAECTLGVRYRRVNADGQVAGGPMYYLRHGFAELGHPGIGRALGAFYAAAMVFGCLGIGNMFQSNQAAAILINISGGEASMLADKAWLIGVVLALAVGIITIGGIRSIAATTVRLVPFMALLYTGLGLLVILMHADALPAAAARIWHGAFSPDGIAGGIVGVLITGFRRAVFSNEAGLGSAAIAHSTARTPYPASEGHVALLEPFIDTVVICTITALVIVLTGTDLTSAPGVNGIEMSTRAFTSVFAWAHVPLAIAAILFAFSTMIAWSYYGLTAFQYLVGNSRLAEVGFKLFFLGFVILGASIELSAVVDLSDALVFVVAIPNLIGLYLLAPVIKAEVKRYVALDRY